MADLTEGPRLEDRPGATTAELQRAVAEYARQVRHGATSYVLKDVPVVTGTTNPTAHGLGKVPSAFFVMPHDFGGTNWPFRAGESTATQVFFATDYTGTADVLVIP